METRQVFKYYNFNNNFNSYNFCPKCGASLSNESVSGRKRGFCKTCSYIHYINPIPAVVTIILNKQKNNFLLARRSKTSFQPDKWCLPGGFIEYDENFLEAGKREIKEETNLDIEITGILNATSNFFNPQLHSIVLTLLGVSNHMDCIPNDDVVELRWFKLDDTLPVLAFKADEFIINRYKNNPGLFLPVDERFA